jgi:hypothetical protein
MSWPVCQFCLHNSLICLVTDICKNDKIKKYEYSLEQHTQVSLKKDDIIKNYEHKLENNPKIYW